MSNLDEEAGGYGSFANDMIGGEPYVWNVASDFTTGSEETTLQSITLSFDQYSAGSGFVLSLYADGDGRPGTLLETLSGPDAPNDATTYDYVSAGTILEAGTTYWWVGTVEAGQFNYHGTYSSSEVSPAGWTIGNFSSYTQLNGGDWESTGGAHTRFAVSVVSAVPEPASSGALAGLVSLGFIWCAVAPAAQSVKRLRSQTLSVKIEGLKLTISGLPHWLAGADFV